MHNKTKQNQVKNYLLSERINLMNDFIFSSLFFNSNSFHEIEKNIIKKYLNFFSSICNKFFIKNAMAKYKIQDLVNHLSKKDVPSFNKNLGLCTEVINIFDSKKVNLQSKAYLKKYNPYKSKAKVFSKLSEIYPSCILALFVKDSY